jgi:uncharacterized membrane protein
MQEAKFRLLYRKNVFRAVVAAAIILAVVLLTLPFLSLGSENPSDWLIFSGRFHPLVIHFPIVLVGVLLLLDLLGRSQWLQPQPVLQWLLLVLTALSSLLAVLIGFALYNSGGYGGDTVMLHLWSGIAVSIGSLFALLLFWYTNFFLQRNSSRAYLGVLVMMNLLVIFASHQGGSLTHGEEFLTEHFPLKASQEEVLIHKPLDEMLVYEDILRPALDARCFSCHNQNKSKGDYLMTDFVALQQGGKSGKQAIVPGSTEQSELFHRINLAPDHDDHMPPEGKTPLSEQEISMLEWWISQGASDTLLLADSRTDSLQYQLLADYAQKLRQQHLVQQQQEQQLDGLIQLVAHDEQAFVLEKNAEKADGLNLSMQFPPEIFDDNQLAELQTVFPHIHKASFAASNITDDGLYHVGQMENIRALFLQQTAIRGSGLVHLAQLKKLEILDLSSTKVDEANLLHVLKIEGLRELYLYETQLNPIIIDALSRNNPQLNVHLVRGSLF